MRSIMTTACDGSWRISACAISISDSLLHQNTCHKAVYLNCCLLVSISHCVFPLLYKSIYKRLLVVSNLGTFLISQMKGKFVSIFARIKLAPPSSTLNGRRKNCAPRRRKLNDEERHLATKPDIGCPCTSIHFLGKKYRLSIAASRSFQRCFV